MNKRILVTTRTGGKVHLQDEGSSVTNCGHWQKANGSFFAIDGSQVKEEQLCERCFPTAKAKANARTIIKPKADWSYLADLTMEELRAERVSKGIDGQTFWAAARIINGKGIPAIDYKRLGINPPQED